MPNCKTFRRCSKTEEKDQNSTKIQSFVAKTQISDTKIQTSEAKNQSSKGETGCIKAQKVALKKKIKLKN